MTDYAKRIYELLDRDRADLRKVALTLPNDSIDLYFRPFTSTQHRDCLARAKKIKEIRDVSSDKVVEETYICDYTYMASVVYYQSLDEKGERIFSSFNDIQRLLDKIPYTKLATLATYMGADIENEIKEFTNG